MKQRVLPSSAVGKLFTCLHAWTASADGTQPTANSAASMRHTPSKKIVCIWQAKCSMVLAWLQAYII
jgi:hypothetical protein